MSNGVMTQVVEVAGALGVLTPFAASQFGLLGPRSRAYLLLNLVGSGVLAYLATVQRQYGFLMLEGVWALVSGWGLLPHDAIPWTTRRQSPTRRS